MTEDFPKKTANALVSLYNKDSDIRRILQWMASRERDSTNTSVDLIVRKFGFSRTESIFILRELSETGCGDFILGRKGSRSRIQWSYSPISLGKAAGGESIELSDVRYDALAWDEEDESSDPNSAVDRAKEIIAEALGTSPLNVDLHFSIRA